MENRGFEGDQARAESSSFPFDVASRSPRLSLHLDSHVYEDIDPGVPANSESLREFQQSAPSSATYFGGKLLEIDRAAIESPSSTVNITAGSGVSARNAIADVEVDSKRESPLNDLRRASVSETSRARTIEHPALLKFHSLKAGSACARVAQDPPRDATFNDLAGSSGSRRVPRAFDASRIEENSLKGASQLSNASFRQISSPDVLERGPKQPPGRGRSAFDASSASVPRSGEQKIDIREPNEEIGAADRRIERPNDFTGTNASTSRCADTRRSEREANGESVEADERIDTDDRPVASSNVLARSSGSSSLASGRERSGDFRDDDRPTSGRGERRVEPRDERELRPSGRRRRKKDCKHCRAKPSEPLADQRTSEAGPDAAGMSTAGSARTKESRLDAETTLARREDRLSWSGRSVDARPARSPVVAVFTISESLRHAQRFPEYERGEADSKLGHASGEAGEDRALITPEKPRGGMRVNSIYSPEHCYADKRSPIFYTDVKESDASFQRAYSLPVRAAQSPSSQNRANLRRSVRGEPPPHPARLRKHRHGWTLHLARPLGTTGCTTRTVVLLFVVVLTLLAIGAGALYILFEPEKLQVIQQYLRSSKGSSSSQHATPGAGLVAAIANATDNDSNVTTTITATTNTTWSNEYVALNETSFPVHENATYPSTEADRAARTGPETGARTGPGTGTETGLRTEPETGTETESRTRPVEEPESDRSNLVNATRYCDDCLEGEVCVALVDEDVPICRIGLDAEDPTGCAGLCLINKQRCHRLDVDAFRCMEVEHYCLDDEWTCSNTLCIPLTKRCDGHMNCYDHSDEYNCACDPDTRFQCGNETSCLPLEKRCDGRIDCWDATDEMNCTLACPLESEFTCSDGQCILKARFCDGLPDCTDGSDEPHGCKGRCNKHEFTCRNSRCITKGMRCNGADDCGDGTDELHCKDRT